LTMTRRRKLESQRHSLAEIRNIMNSMKTLAYLETRKLARFLDAQHVVVNSMEEAAMDFIAFHPQILPETKEIETSAAYIVIGTERGFCGDFNHALLRRLESVLEAGPAIDPILIVVGRKLHALVKGDARVAALIDGAGVVEEATFLLQRVLDELLALQNRFGVQTVYCLYHGEEGAMVVRKLLPPFRRLRDKAPDLPHPPILNLSPGDFLISLTYHYLFATLHEILYASLMAENHQRVAHLEGAVRRLDDEAADLSRRGNILRQEEIIEEMEVILLNQGIDHRKDFPAG